MTITIAGIGPGDPKWVTTEGTSLAYDEQYALFAQTGRHEFVQEVLEIRDCVCMDDLYEASADFDSLNAAIAERLTSQTRDVVYLVPGQGVTGNGAIEAIMRLAKQKGGEVVFSPGIGYETAALAQADLSAEGYGVSSAADAMNIAPRYQTLYVITELNDRVTASEVKLALAHYYPDTWEIIIADTIGGRCEPIPLSGLDRLDEYSHGLCAVIPPVPYEAMQEMGFAELVKIMARLRGPGGCPWDREQTHESIRRNLIEEAYETLDAIDAQDTGALCEELGDLLLQVVLHAQIALDHGEFDVRNVCDGVCRKLIHRHPHVFGDIVAENSGAVLKNWENIKLKEKSMTSQTEAMQAVPKAMPALMRAYKIQQKAAHVGFDWDDPAPALDKVVEEVGEVKAASADTVAQELGDLLFAAVNAARKYKVDPELALYAASEKFIDRFEYIETNSDHDLRDMSLADMDYLWEKSKKIYP